jgi:hypothetical protein
MVTKNGGMRRIRVGYSSKDSLKGGSYEHQRSNNQGSKRNSGDGVW